MGQEARKALPERDDRRQHARVARAPHHVPVQGGHAPGPPAQDREIRRLRAHEVDRRRQARRRSGRDRGERQGPTARVDGVPHLRAQGLLLLLRVRGRVLCDGHGSADACSQGDVATPDGARLRQHHVRQDRARPPRVSARGPLHHGRFRGPETHDEGVRAVRRHLPDGQGRGGHALDGDQPRRLRGRSRRRPAGGALAGGARRAATRPWTARTATARRSPSR